MSSHDEIHCDVPLPDRKILAEICSRPSLFRGLGPSVVIGLPSRGVSSMRPVETLSPLDSLIFWETTTKPPMVLSGIERAL